MQHLVTCSQTDCTCSTHFFFVSISTQTKTFFPRGREEEDPMSFISLHFVKICDQAFCFPGKVVDMV